MFRGKKYKQSAQMIDRAMQYDPSEALDLVVKGATAKFDETVELHIKLGVDSRHADQQVRGAVVLPNGTGKTRRVLVFAKDAKVDEAKAAGADYVGGMELVEKITKENWFDFDVVVASPDMMGIVGRLGKVLGPKGLMPSPKAGTVTPNVAAAVTEIKAGIRGLRRGRRAAGAAGTGVVVEFIEIVVILGIGLCQLLQVIHKSHCSVSSRIVIL